MTKSSTYILLIALLSILPGIHINAAADDSIPATREQIVIPPLFTYIEAPDSLPDLTAKANYLVKHFWDPMDFTLPAVGQIPLSHAFSVFVTPMRWADKEVTDAAVSSLLRSLSKNPTLLLQFTKAAEDNLYSANAPIWIDHAYIPFLKALTANKVIDKNRKARYTRQLAALQRCATGAQLPPFAFTLANGDKASINYTTPLTLIVFGNPSCVDCRMAKVKLQTSDLIESLLSQNKLALYYIVPDAEAEEGWDIELAAYPYKWINGAGEALDDIYDIRNTPTIYLLDAKGTILQKNQPVESIINAITELSTQQ